MALTWDEMLVPVKPRYMLEQLQKIGLPQVVKMADTRSQSAGNPQGAPQRPHARPGASRMIWSGLARNRKRLAEMTGPAAASFSAVGNRSDLNGKVQDKIIPTVADVVYKASPVFIRIRTNNGQQFDGGILIRQNIGYAELNGGPFGRGETFNTDYVQTDTAFSVNPKFLMPVAA